MGRTLGSVLTLLVCLWGLLPPLYNLRAVKIRLDLTVFITISQSVFHGRRHRLNQGFRVVNYI